MSRELNEIMCIKHVAQCLTHEEHSIDISQYYLLLFRLSDDVYKNFEDMETTILSFAVINSDCKTVCQQWV